MFKSISIPQKCLLLAITHGRDMLGISAGRMGREPGQSSLFTPCATQQHRATRPKLQDLSLALLFEADGPAPSNDGICLSKHQKGSVTSDSLWALTPQRKAIYKSFSPVYTRVFQLPTKFPQKVLLPVSSEKAVSYIFPTKNLRWWLRA